MKVANESGPPPPENCRSRHPLSLSKEIKHAEITRAVAHKTFESSRIRRERRLPTLHNIVLTLSLIGKPWGAEVTPRAKSQISLPVTHKVPWKSTVRFCVRKMSCIGGGDRNHLPPESNRPIKSLPRPCRSCTLSFFLSFFLFFPSK